MKSWGLHEVDKPTKSVFYSECGKSEEGSVGRSRKRQHRKLPQFVYLIPDGYGNKYYCYQHPITGKRSSLGTDKPAAIVSGNALNERIWGNDKSRLRFLRNGSESMRQLLSLFQVYKNERTNSDNTRKENDIKFTQYKRWFKKSPPLLTIEDLNEHLDGLPYDSVRKHRILLRQMFEFARSRDMIPDKTKHQNPAELILLPVKPKKKSERLSEEQFWKVYEHAPEMLQKAMGIALITSMRRGDISALQRNQCFKAVKDVNGQIVTSASIQYIPQKTVENPDPMPTECFIPEVDWARYIAPLLLSVKGDTLFPFKPEWLTRQFSTLARNITGLSSGVCPPFREIRSLSARLYEQTEDKSKTQRRMGHHSTQMTDLYLAGGEVRYVPVKCDLSLRKKRKPSQI